MYVSLPEKINAKKLVYMGGVVLLAGAWAVNSAAQSLHKAAAVTPAPVIEKQIAPPAVAASPPSQQAAPQTIRKHTVAAGDTLIGIAKKYGVDVETLSAANPGISEVINPGDQLVVLPSKGVMHEVGSGDTLWDIANTYGIQVETIRTANGKDSDKVVVGEKLFIPGACRDRADTAAVVSRAIVSRFIWPSQGEISSPFGWRWGRLHAGVDIANDIGTYVMATRAGRIIWAGWKGGYGYSVMIDHGGGYVSLYGHLDNYFVERGQYVRGGQRIASMGSTGNSTGPHLHFEIQKEGEPIDPMGMLP